MNPLELQPVRQLLDALCEGRIDATGFAELDTLARTHREARQLLLDYLELDGLLRWEFGTGLEGMGLVVGATDDQLLDADLAKHPPREPFLPALSSRHVAKLSSHTPVLGWLTAVSRRVPGGEFSVGSLILLVLVAAFWGLSQAILNPQLNDRQLATTAADQARGAGSEGTVVATIHDTTDVEWSPDSKSPLSASGRGAGGEGAAIVANEPLSITSGLVELQLRQGATLIIEGPAEWSVDGDNQASLKRGKLVAHVPQQANGFTLETPGAVIVDRGTEFGAEVDGRGRTSVQVLDGKVDLSRRAQGESTRQQPVRLTAGSAVQVPTDDQPVVYIPFAADRFQRSRRSHTATSGRVAIIPLGNLFDDARGTPLDDAISSDEFGATAEIDDLGVERVLYGGDPIKQISRGVSSIFRGWAGQTGISGWSPTTVGPVSRMRARYRKPTSSRESQREVVWRSGLPPSSKTESAYIPTRW